MPLAASEMAAMRAAQEAAMPNSCTVVSALANADGMGGSTSGASTAGPYICRLSPAGASGQEKMVANRVGFVGLWRIDVQVTNPVTEGNTVLISGRTFNVVDVTTDAWGVSKFALATEVG